MIILQMLKIQQTVTYYTDKDHKLYLPVAIQFHVYLQQIQF